MFLSQLSLNIHKPEVHRDLASPYEMHRTLMRAFPNRDDGGAGRVLFRIDVSRDEDRPPVVLVQSEREPDWSTVTQRDYASVSGPKHIELVGSESTALPVDAARIVEGDRFRFRLVANPTVKRKVEGRKNGRRDACVTEEQQLAWLVRKGEAGGFSLTKIETDDEREVPNVTVTPMGRMSSWQKKGGRTLSHQGVRFDGVLVVTDPEQFAETLASGIGSAKAFGFGLLSVARC